MIGASPVGTESAVTVPRVVVAAPRSGEGKTTVALGLMAALRHRGLRVQGYKVGPDYLDTGYQQYAAGAPGRNLDLFMMGEDAVLQALASEAADVAVIEGVMGLFDGHSDKAVPTSTAEVAKRVGAPVVLVIDASHLAASVGAVALGFSIFDPELRVRGVILNRWSAGRSSGAEEEALRRAGVEVLGYLPACSDVALPSRHLGLVVADEQGSETAAVIDRLGEHVEEHVDVARLLEIAGEAPAVTVPAPPASPAAEAAGRDWVPASSPSRRDRLRIAVAWDDAFAFYYADNLALLRTHGAELVQFSPLKAAELPVCDGLYLGGGYPELHAEELSANVRFRRGLSAALEAGLPAYAECGGLLYLCESLVDLDGRTWPLVGAVPGRATMHPGLQGLGYREARLRADSLLGPAGAVARGHEFRYSTCEIDAASRAAYLVDGVPEGYAAGDLFASYVHLHFAGCPALLEHWLERCRAFAGASRSRGASS